MLKSFMLLLLLFYFPAYSQTIADKRIVGGQHIADNNASTTASNIDTINQWPWVVALDNGKGQYCGASLIDRYWLLTAAHCLYDSANNSLDNTLQIQAIFLKSELKKYVDSSFTRNISKVIIHPDYDYDLNINDIAVLKLEQAVDNISPVSLPGSSYDAFSIADGTLATVIGWGITQDAADKNSILRKVEVPITNQAVCGASMHRHGWDIQDSMICAGYSQGGKDACSGDSGSPLVHFSLAQNNWEQVGIVSFGFGCALPNEYGIYTRVAKYTAPQQFINKSICETMPATPNLQITQENMTYNIKFSTAAQDSNFRLYFAPYPQKTPIKYLDIIDNEYSITLLANETYFIAAQTRNLNCVSPFTEQQLINL